MPFCWFTEHPKKNFTEHTHIIMENSVKICQKTTHMFNDDKDMSYADVKIKIVAISWFVSK